MIDGPRWSTRIALARQRGYFRHSDKRDCGDWQRCPFAEQDPRIKRDEDNEPWDPVLRRLGAEFSLAVRADDFQGARRALDCIEGRAHELVKMYDSGEPTGEAPRERYALDLEELESNGASVYG